MTFSPHRVLYEDNHLLAVVKQAGELSQGDATGDTSLLDLCKAYLKEKYGKPGDVFLGLVHRLDRPVSGVMLFARTSKAAARLSAQFRARSIDKIYTAVVEGEPPRDSGTLEHFLSGGEHRTRVSVCRTKTAKSKRAELAYRVLAKETQRTALAIKLVTGAKHQIRVQLAAIGCPIVGDFKYDARPKPAAPQSLGEGRAIALHARRLTVEHPTRREALTFEAEYPGYWPFGMTNVEDTYEKGPA